jgi:hemerythrin-like metal-binding protein
MGFIEWNVNFYTGLPEVDRQHNKLVALANGLSEASDHKPEILQQAFQELTDYVVELFSLEERLMEQAEISCEHIDYHRNAHVLFVGKVVELWNARDSGPEETLAEMLEFLKSWILQHILHTDRRMACEIHEKLGSAAPHNMFTHF